MVAIEPITPLLFDRVYDAFLVDDDPKLGKEDWRRLFTPVPSQQEEHSGYALLDQDKVVGILGMVFSQRTIAGRVHRFCNLHSWFVDENYRAHSLVLMRPAMRLKSHTLTDFTPTEQVCTLLAKLGFKRLESRLTLLFPGFARASTEEFEVCEVTSSTASQLSAAERELWNDHQDPSFSHLLLRQEDSYCYAISSRVDRHYLPYCHVHYLSNKEFFLQHNRLARRHLLQVTGGRFIAIESRWLADHRLSASVTIPFGARQLYRPVDLASCEIDSLYSEVSVLRLTTFPSLSHSLKRVIQRACGSS